MACGSPMSGLGLTRRLRLDPARVSRSLARLWEALAEASREGWGTVGRSRRVSHGPDLELASPAETLKDPPRRLPGGYLSSSARSADPGTAR